MGKENMVFKRKLFAGPIIPILHYSNTPRFSERFINDSYHLDRWKI